MPRFYFDLYDGANFAPDPQGVDLPDIETAKDEATRTLSEIAAQEIPGDGASRLFRIVILDETRSIISEARIDFRATRASPGNAAPADSKDNHDE
jgi:hypothetical protein